MSTVGKNIKQLRGLKGLSQDELAKLIFVSRQTVSNYETGKSKPDIDMLVSISEVFDTDANELIYGISAKIGQKVKVKALIKFVVVFIVLILSVSYHESFVNAVKDRYFSLTPILLVDNILRPSLYLLVGWYTISLAHVTLGVKRLSGKAGRYFYYVLLIVTVLYFIIITPMLLSLVKTMYDLFKLRRTGGAYSYSYQFVFVPVWDRLATTILFYSGKYHFIFVLIGAALGTTKPKQKQK